MLSLQDFAANKCVLKGKYLLHPLFVMIIFLIVSLLVSECLLFNLQQFTAGSPTLKQGGFLYYFSLAMFDKDFEIELHPIMAACARGFERRCEVPSQIDRDLWRNAWHRFSTDSFGQIPPLKCIRLSNPDAKNELVLRRLRYRLLAVLHFLPKFKAKESLVTGKARKSVRKIINLLEFWKQTLPPNTLVELPVKPRIILPKPDPDPRSRKAKAER